MKGITLALDVVLAVTLLCQWGEQPQREWGEPPVRTADQIVEIGRSRVLLFHDKTITGELKRELDVLRRNGWRVNEGEDAHIQLVGPQQDAYDAFNLDKVKKPFGVYVKSGEAIRSLQSGCTTPLDRWSFGWLHNGVNQRPKPKRLSASVPTTGYYPLRGSWWSVDGNWRPSRQRIIDHLMNGPFHAGTFKRQWLNGLTYAELQSAHSDQHEGRLNRAYVNKMSKQKTQSILCYWCPT